MPTRRRVHARLAPLVAAALLGACAVEPRAAGDDARRHPASATAAAARAAIAGARWLPVPPESSIADPRLLASVRRGRAILAATRDSLPEYVGNDLRCTSCHLDDGTRANAMPWVGIHGQFPQYRSREGTVFRLEDRINGCLRRSMNGEPMPLEHPAMRDMVAYMAFLSRGTPVGATVPGGGLPKLAAALEGDTLRGRDLYAQSCASCHGANGEGTSAATPLWGERSFNIGAGMSRLRTAAAFIKHNMPYDRPGTLSDQAAFDIAAWVISRPRPDFAGKELDWPNGDPPPDVAYQTRAAAARDPR